MTLTLLRRGFEPRANPAWLALWTCVGLACGAPTGEGERPLEQEGEPATSERHLGADKTQPSVLEGEAMPLTAKKGAARTDATASGGKALLIWGNDTASGTLSGSGTLTLDARSTNCGGWAQAEVTVDGVKVMTLAVSASSWTTFTVPGILDAGTHGLTVAFVNDGVTGTCDRNLYVDRLRLSNDEISPPAPGLNPFRGAKLYVDPASAARATVNTWKAQGRTEDARQLEKIAGAAKPVRYFAEWTETGNSGGVKKQVSAYLATVRAAGALPVIGAYAMVNRDCGGFSSGGFTTAAEYRRWIDGYAAGIADEPAVVLLEPDSLAQALPGGKCQDQAGERFALLKYAVTALKAKPHAHVYLDVGHSGWHTPEEVIAGLKQAGIEKADGFATNNANFRTTVDEIAWGEKVSAGVGGKHFIIDTSRNGLGPYTGGTHDGDCPAWANPPGRALGARPTADTGHVLVDAFFWLKSPGASDGKCGPFGAAGAWTPEYALGLSQRAPF